MTTKQLFNKTLAVLAVLSISATSFSLLAQEPRKETAPRTMEIFVASGTGNQGTYRFMHSNSVFNLDTVKGAPYSADAVTATTQILPDGNRIFRETSSFVARDSEGRSRRESSLPTIGAWVPEDEGQRHIMIHDPVERVSYTLDPETRTARKSRIPIVVTGGDAESRNIWVSSGEDVTVHSADGDDKGVFIVRRTPEGVKVEGPDGKVVETKVQLHLREGNHVVDFTSKEGNVKKGEDISHANVQFFSTHSGAGPDVLHFNNSHEMGEGRTEDLGTKTMQGVLVEGSRTIRTIEAGQVGNQLPIEIVSERWFSPDLQTVVMTRYYDPRFGETTFELRNLSRSEPEPGFFEVPSDYTIKSDRNFQFRQRRH